jgi:transposase
MIFVGIDWAEDHHDVCALDEHAEALDGFRISEGIEGTAELHARLADLANEPEEVVIGIETDRGLLVNALVAAGYQVYAINPMSVARYRERHSISGAKSDPGDAKVLADLVRTDRHNHRPLAADSELQQAIRVLARSHQSLIWARQRHTNQMRNALREYYPAALEAFGTDLAHKDAIAMLTKAPTPDAGRRLSTRQIRAALKRGGRQRSLDRRAAEIRDALRSQQMEAPPLVADAFGATVAAAAAVVAALNEQVAEVEARLVERFEQHPDAEIILSQPGLGHVLGARVLAEFGDAPNRYENAKARRNYAGTSPITVASGTSRHVKARYIRNSRLIDACWQWALPAMKTSPGARAYYDAHNPGPHTGKTARRKLANKLVGILHGCLKHRVLYDEAIAFANWLPETDDQIGEAA